MKELITKIFAVFALIVFVTMLVRHGQIDFSVWDKFAEKTKEAVNSEQSQQLIDEVKETSYDVGTTFLDKFREDARKLRTEYQKEGIDTISIEEPSSTELLAVTLVRVVDGDTLLVKDGSGEETYVRLIGIDTPESVNPDESFNNNFGKMASEYTQALLAGKDTVYLQFDKEYFDTYDRALAYVWLKYNVNLSSSADVKNYMLNGLILNYGYAVNKEYEPNTRYSQIFRQLCNDAKNQGSGLWSYEGFKELF